MDWLIAAIGLAFMGAPWLFGYHDNVAASWVSIVLGVFVFAVAGYRAAANASGKWEDWTAALAGFVAIIAALVLKLSAGPLFLMLAAGVVIAALSTYQAVRSPTRAGPAVS